MTTLYTISNITFTYDATSHSKINALSGLSLSINHGDRIAILGLSGSGKSTFLKMLGGLLPPSSGYIYYNSTPLFTPPADVSLLLQNYGLFPWKTVEENLILPLLLKKIAYDEDLILYWLKALGLEDKRKVYPKNLSGGQMQRLSLARALLKNADVYIFDEATSSIDNESEEIILEVLKRLKKDKTIIFISHRLKSTMIADKIYLLDGGSLKEEGDFDALLRQKGFFYQMYTEQAELENYAGGEVGSCKI